MKQFLRFLLMLAMTPLVLAGFVVGFVLSNLVGGLRGGWQRGDDFLD